MSEKLKNILWEILAWSIVVVSGVTAIVYYINLYAF